MLKTQYIIVGVKANTKCQMLRTKKSPWPKLKPSQNGKSLQQKNIIAEIKYFAISEKFAKILREESCVMINLLI